MAVARHHSMSSNFWTVAPHDVHHPMAVRLGHAWCGYNRFPSTAPFAFYESLLAGAPQAGAPPHLNVDEDSLQQLAASNPIACMLAHTKIMRAVESAVRPVRARLPRQQHPRGSAHRQTNARADKAN